MIVRDMRLYVSTRIRSISVAAGWTKEIIDADGLHSETGNTSTVNSQRLPRWSVHGNPVVQAYLNLKYVRSTGYKTPLHLLW